MEVIQTPTINRVDELAKLVFDESIEVVGGLKKLIDFRNLTWLPSLAQAAYVLILREEGGLTHLEIAEKLGIGEQTVNNILRANEEGIEAFLRGEIQELDTHKAGAIAKLAYKRLKTRGFEEVTQIDRQIAEILNVLWAFNVLRNIRGLDFPVDKEALKSRLVGLKIKNQSVEAVLDKIEYPVNTPAELLHKIKTAIG